MAVGGGGGISCHFFQSPPVWVLPSVDCSTPLNPSHLLFLLPEAGLHSQLPSSGVHCPIPCPSPKSRSNHLYPPPAVPKQQLPPPVSSTQHTAVRVTVVRLKYYVSLVSSKPSRLPLTLGRNLKIFLPNFLHSSPGVTREERNEEREKGLSSTS